MMSQNKQLANRKVAVLVADGFEKVELTIPLKALKASGAQVDLISLRHGRIRGVNLHEPASRVRVDKTISEVRSRDYDALFIPGGFISPDLLRQSEEVREFVRDFDDQQKPIASICHGPWVLASSDLLKGRHLTSWPGVRDDLVNAGATWLNQEIVYDRNLLTSRGPQDLKIFSKSLISFIANQGSHYTQDSRDFVSDPKAKAPPAIVLKALKWIPKPSYRTAVGIALLSVGAYLAQKNRISSKGVSLDKPEEMLHEDHLPMMTKFDTSTPFSAENEWSPI